MMHTHTERQEALRKEVALIVASNLLDRHKIDQIVDLIGREVTRAEAKAAALESVSLPTWKDRNGAEIKGPK